MEKRPDINHFNPIEALKDYNHKYENILEDPNSKLGNFLNYFLYALVLAFCLVITIDSINSAFVTEKFLLYFDGFISTVFLVEYVYRWVLAREKILFFFKPMRIIDFLSFAPFFMGFFVSSQYFTFLRMVKFLRVLKLLRNIPMTSSFLKSISYYKDEFKAILVIYFIILFISSALVYHVEYSANPEVFSSIPQALWWGLVTMTTVGYGDAVPVTFWGKAIGSILVFIGPIIGSVIGAITILIFMENAKISEKVNAVNVKICPQCRSKNPRKANYCMKCGHEFPFSLKKNHDKNYGQFF